MMTYLALTLSPCTVHDDKVFNNMNTCHISNTTILLLLVIVCIIVAVRSPIHSPIVLDIVHTQNKKTAPSVLSTVKDAL